MHSRAWVIKKRNTNLTYREALELSELPENMLQRRVIPKGALYSASSPISALWGGAHLAVSILHKGIRVDPSQAERGA